MSLSSKRYGNGPVDIVRMMREANIERSNAMDELRNILNGAPLEFETMRYGPRDISAAKTAAEAASTIMTNMFYQTFDDDRVWTNDEWRAAIKEAAVRYPAFDGILSDERVGWRNDDFAERVIAIRDSV